MRRASLSILPRISWLASLDKSGFQAAGPLVRGFADQADLKKTPLYDFHVEQGGDSKFHIIAFTSS